MLRRRCFCGSRRGRRRSIASKEMHDFFQIWEMHDFRLARTLHGFADKTVQKFATAVLFFFGFALLSPLFLLPRLFRDSRVRYLLVAGAVFALGLCANAWFFPHYAAPFTAAIYVLLLQCMRHLRQCRPGRPSRSGLALVRYALLVCLMLAGIRIYAQPLGLAIARWPSMWYGTEPLGLPRAKVAAQLETMPGKQLAIVRYTPEHAPFDDWVYNAADIDASKVVWAREMHAASNRALLRYFRDRQVWLVEPDFDPPRVSPYPREAPSARHRRDGDPTDNPHQDQHREMGRVQQIGVDAPGSILRSRRRIPIERKQLR